MQFWCVKSLARNSGRVKLLTNLMSALPPLIWKEIHFFLRIASPIHPQYILTVYFIEQGGRSCTGAQVAPAEKFGLGRKF